MRRSRRAPLHLVALLPALLLTVSPGVIASEPGATPRPCAAVFTFPDPVDYPNHLIGRRAADAVHAALATEGPWEMVDRDAVGRLCEAEQLRVPFGVGHLQMLGQRLDAPLAVSGVIEVCEVNRERGTAQVTLLIELVETLGGASLASKRGVASARRGADEVAPIGQIVDRALLDAALDAVRALTAFEPTSASVVTTLPDGRIVLDGPEKPPLPEGAKMTVLRGQGADIEMIGAVSVRKVRGTVVHARPIAGDDFRQGDTAAVVAR